MTSIASPTLIEYTDGNDIVTATGTNYEHDTKGGNDYISLTSSAKYTYVSAGKGNDTVSASTCSSDAYIWLEDGDDIYIGSKVNSSEAHNAYTNIYGGAGNDSIAGYNGQDYISGSLGKDYLWGGADNDTLSGGAGDDIICGDEGDDVIEGNSGGDTIWGGAGNDFIYGGDNPNYYRLGEAQSDESLSNWLYGGDGNDSIVGGYYSDSLGGGTGADWLMGGKGNDSLWGCDGSADGQMDVFIYNDGDGVDTIMDFENGIDGIWVTNTSFIKAEVHGNDVWAYTGADSGIIIKNAVGMDIKYMDASSSEIKTARIG